MLSRTQSRHIRDQDAELHSSIRRAREWQRRRPKRSLVADFEVEADHVFGKNMLVLLLGVPVEEDARTSRTPYVVFGLLAVIALVWILQLSTGLIESVNRLAVVPAEIIEGRRLHTLLTGMFAHR